MAEATRAADALPRTTSRGEMRLTGLYVYPVKSARGVALTEAEVVATGLRHDRRWMVVDDAGRFVTQREEPRLALLHTALTPDALVLAAAGHGEARVPLADDPGAPDARVTVWGDTVAAAVAGREASELVSDLLGARRRLVRFRDAARRDVPREPARVPPTPPPFGARVLFADAYPFLLLSQAAVDLLNAKLAERGEPPVGVERFRPNLVVSGCEPHAEDGWESLTVGDVAFTVAKPCTRCAVPTVDPATAAVGREPLRTLARYRRDARGRVTFGQNLLHHDVGRLALGDEVTAAPARAGAARHGRPGDRPA